MDWDQRDRKWNEPPRRERDGSNAPVHRSFAEEDGGRIYQSLRETILQHVTDPLEWRPCPYCGHGYRNNTRLERHLEGQHGPELRVQGSIRGRMSAAER